MSHGYETSTVMLCSGLQQMVLHDTLPARRRRSPIRVDSDYDDPTTGWPVDPFAGAACKGWGELFDLELDHHGRRGKGKLEQRARMEQVCNGCPLRDTCEYRVRVA